MEKMNISIQKQMEQLWEYVDDSILASLLLIRQLIQDGKAQPLFSAEVDSGESCCLEEILSDSCERDCMSAITKTLTLLKPRFPFVERLIEQNEKKKMEEDVLRKLVCLLSDVSADDLPSALIYENYLKRKVPVCNTASGDFYTPKNIVQCLAALLDSRYGTIYQDEESYMRTQIDLILNGLYVDLGEVPANTLQDDQHKDKKFDYILANPPFNSANWCDGYQRYSDCGWRYGVPPHSNANFAWLQHILCHLKLNSRAAVILPNGTLTTQISREVIIRKSIVEDNLVEAIITLPPGLFDSTKIPCCIWLLQNTHRKTDEILFVDAAHMRPEITKEITSAHIEQLMDLLDRHRQGELHGSTEWYGVASLDTIKQNEFILSPNLYISVSRPGTAEIRGEYEKFIKVIDEISALPVEEAVLASIVEWKDIEAAKFWQKANLLELYSVFGGVTKRKDSFGKGCPLLDVKSVIHYPYVPDGIAVCVDVTEEEKEKYSIKYGDIFLNRTSETIKELACCSVATKDQDVVYSGFLKRLRPSGEHIMNPFYAICYFSSQIYRWEIEKVSTVYTTYASMDNRKLSKIMIYYPNEEMQKRIGGTMYTVFQYRQKCSDVALENLLKEFERMLIQQHITYPILCIQNKEGDYQCR